jgi:hypothetical protein
MRRLLRIVMIAAGIAVLFIAILPALYLRRHGWHGVPADARPRPLARPFGGL